MAKQAGYLYEDGTLAPERFVDVGEAKEWLKENGAVGVGYTPVTIYDEYTPQWTGRVLVKRENKNEQ